MDEVLNELGLPNEVGFEISKNTIRSLLTSESYERLIDVVKSKFNKATSNIGLDESLNLAILMDFTIKFKGGRKNIAVDEFSIIKSIYDYFNTEYIYQNDVHFGLLDNNQYLNEEIKKLQDFLRERIKELRNITNVNQLKSISKSLYDSYMMAYNDKVVDGNFTLFEWNIFFQKEINLDIERFQRLKTWMESFIKELTSPLPFSLFSNINKDKTKLFLSAQFLLLAILLTEPNRSILIRNSIELIKSIEDKNVNLSNIFLWQCEDLCNVNTLQRVEYKKLNLQMPLELINLYLKQEDIKKTVDVLLSYSNQDFKNDDLSNVYNKLNELIQGALNEAIKIGLKDVNLNDLKQEALKELGDTLDNDKKQLKLKSYIDRIDMFLHCLKPYKVQTGSGKFKNFHVFYYENGMVVLDKLNGEYGSLYIMPIMIYLSILKNENIKNLYEVRNILGVRSVSHRKNNWQIEVKNLIDSHKITMEEIEFLENASEVSLPVNDEQLQSLKKQYKDNDFLQTEIKRKEIERKKRFEEIDEEIKRDKASECSKDLLDDEEEQIIEEVDEPNDFLVINDSSIQSKVTRNPKVSLFTKLRTKDDQGMMHCDLCGEFVSFDTRNFEAHHIIPLANNGVDNVYNTVCLCGNCHNRIHSKVPPTMFEIGWMLQRVRERVIKTTPFYLQNFDRLFNPNYNFLYGSIDNYDEEMRYYENNKENEDRNFLVEWNTKK
ncbi:MAG: HNH endonuclease [Firmicutes bacterium]|nr:HNH endonuclease [Bacillota bacterium]